jgi:hypothetical protein
MPDDAPALTFMEDAALDALAVIDAALPLHFADGELARQDRTALRGMLAGGCTADGPCRRGRRS